MDVDDLGLHYKSCNRPQNADNHEDCFIVSMEEEQENEDFLFVSREIGAMKNLLELECTITRTPMNLEQFEQILTKMKEDQENYLNNRQFCANW